MKLETMAVKNFKTLCDIRLEHIPRLCVFIGANGSGKTTLFDVFGFLKDCLTHNVSKALQVRGGFKEVISRNSQKEQIEIELQFRLAITGVERLVTYQVHIGWDGPKAVINREVLRYKRGASGSPYHFLDFAKGRGFAITNEEDFKKTDEPLKREEQELDSSDTLAIKGLGQFHRFKAASALRQLVENWYVSDFHINLARGSKDVSGYDEHLSVSGDNLQLVANNFFQNHREIFDGIIAQMKQRVPGIGDIQPESTADGRLLLKFRDGPFRDPFIDRYVSDGTLKMFAYLVLLNDPYAHPLLCVEEPENQLYPDVLSELAEEFAAYADRGGQVFVSTHSPDFLNAVEIENVFHLKKGEDGYTFINRACEDRQLDAYMKDGARMGELWKEGWFGRVVG